jgi:glycoside/pentoside/hexuronide:cation symporter, GPH family
MSDNTLQPIPPLTKLHKFCYGLGQFGWASKDTCFHYFLFFYYTQFLGLSPSLAGLAALMALVADGISDPIIGQLSDNWRSKRWGRRHPFMALGLVPYIAALLAIFNPPTGLPETALFAWYLVFAIVIRTFLTLYTVPHMAMGAELSDDYQERTSISVYRNSLGYVGGLSIQVIAWFLVIPAAVAAGVPGEGYSNVGYIAAALALAGMGAALFGTAPRIPYLLQTSDEQKARPWYYAFKDIIQVLRHPSASILFFAALAITTLVGISNTMLLHVNNFFYGFSSEQMGIFMTAVFIALVPASWLAIYGSRRLGKRNAVVALVTLMALIGPVPALCHLYGLAPATGTGALLAFVCFFLILHQSLYIGSIHVAGAMLPDVLDEMELNTNLRQEGMLNSAMMLTQKVTFGLGALFAGLAIDFAGFEGVTSVADTTPQMLSRLIWVYGPGLSLLGLLGALIYSRYSLSEQRCEEIKAELAARRA